MTKAPRILAVAAATLLTLAACEQKQPEVVGGPAEDAVTKEAKNRPAVTLPAAIKTSKVYRCKDKSVVYVNYLDDNVSANVRDKEEEPPAVTLKAAAPGEAFIGVPPAGEGFKLVGSGNEVTYTSPDSGTQVCKA